MANYYEDAVEQKAKEVVEDLLKHHKVYGVEPIFDAGLLGIITRARDRLAKAKTLTHNNRDRPAVRKAFLSLAGYALIGLLWLDGQFGLPEREKD